MAGVEFGGHLLPGIASVCFSLWWMINAACRYTTCRKFNVPFRSSSWFVWNRFPNTPIEPLLFLSISFYDIISQLYWATRGESFNFGNLQHVAMYFFPLLICLCQIVQFKNGALPSGLDYLGYILMFGNVALQFYNHLDGKLPVDVKMHMMIISALMGTAIAFAFEMFNKNRPIFLMVRAIFVFLFGSNMIAIGVLAFPPGRSEPFLDLNAHSSVGIVTSLFTFQMFFAALLVVVINLVAMRFYSGDTVYVNAIRNNGQGKQEYDQPDIGFDGDDCSPPEYLLVRKTDGQNCTRKLHC